MVGSASQVEGDCLTLGLDLVPDAELRIRLRSGTFYVGDVPGLSDVPPPDFTTADADTLWSGMVSLGVRVRTILCGRSGAPVLSSNGPSRRPTPVRWTHSCRW